MDTLDNERFVHSQLRDFPLQLEGDFFSLGERRAGGSAKAEKKKLSKTLIPRPNITTTLRV